ncbi:MAG: putative oxidoreductase FAD-binding subunit [Armatimonadetes bacterium]|nr:putative oxidoreductase FAD-binding subunit [Armatimonadota bacterium]
MRDIQYAAPQSVQDAVAILSQFGSRARVLAGGTDLIVQVREHIRDVDVVVDGKRIPELMELRYDASEGLTLGAAVPCHVLYTNPDVIRAYPGLVDSASIIGGIGIQGRASVGGNLCNSGPAADSVPALIAYSAVAQIGGPNGVRTVPVEEFCTAPGVNVLGEGELLISLHLPAPPAHSGGRYLRFIPRNEMDIAEVGVGAFVVLDTAGENFVSARIALSAVAPRPLFVPEAGAALAGQPVSAESIAAAAALARAAATPITDQRGTAEHRKHLAGVLTQRALQGAIDRAKSA